MRKALEPDRPPRAATGLLDRQGPGYVLRVRPESVDSERFAALAEHGARLLSDDPPAAAESLATALALWRGPAYADLGDAEVASAEIARLENARLAARQDHAAARLAMGAAVQAVGELESLVREHPLAERSWELLALALYRSGRQGDALAALRTARERLIEELGVDSGPSLRAMEAAVLRQDPALEQAAPKEAATVAEPREPARPRLPVPLTRLIGREAAVSAVRDLLAAHRLVTITGPGGAGKSRVALEIAREHPDEDAGGPPGRAPRPRAGRDLLAGLRPRARRSPRHGGPGGGRRGAPRRGLGPRLPGGLLPRDHGSAGRAQERGHRARRSLAGGLRRGDGHGGEPHEGGRHRDGTPPHREHPWRRRPAYGPAPLLNRRGIFHVSGICAFSGRF
ncbi:BTAD domain-containing putative transcriptional regulator [Nonomuraea helvata]|uniref:BTAD domain-containing putative transcriptional regulator n=1 Tax=Nonomuraea helvata TaxID=37484 RepID=UPI00366FAAF2